MRWVLTLHSTLYDESPIALQRHSSLNQGRKIARCLFGGDIEGKLRKGFGVDFH